MKNNIVATDNRLNKLRRSPSLVEKSGNPGVVDEKEKPRSLNPVHKRLKPLVIDINSKLTLPDHFSNDELFKQIGKVVVSINKDLKAFDTLAHSWLQLIVYSLRTLRITCLDKESNETTNHQITQAQYYNYKLRDRCKAKKFHRVSEVIDLKDMLDRYLVKLNHSINYPDNK